MKVGEVKSKHGIRKILILTEEEKEYRRELKERLEKYELISPFVYSFTKGKSTKSALERIRENIDEYKYFIKLDIRKYYYSIDTNKLIEMLRSKTGDAKLVEEIRNILNDEQTMFKIKQGIALGSPLSNILGNIYLCDLDYKYGDDYIYVRFCDDIVILAHDNNIVDEVKKELKEYNLEINDTKTFIGSYGDSISFLGENIYKTGSAKEALTFKDMVIISRDFNNKEKEKFIEEKVSCLGEAAIYAYRNIALGESYEDIVEKLIEEFKYSVVEEINNYKVECEDENSLQNKLLEIFSIRQKGYYTSTIEGIKNYQYIDKILDNDVINSHLNGDISLAVRLDREDNKSNMVVLDLDEIEGNEIGIKAALEENDLTYYKEISGKKGYHYWIFFERFYNLKEINRAMLHLKEKYFNESKIEIIPRSDNVEESQRIIKIPYGIHPENKERSIFLGLSLEDEIIYSTLPKSEDEYLEFINKFNNEFPKGKELLDKCSILNTIIKDGIIAKEMPHYKRLITLYNFKFLDDGDKMIHLIFSNMTNYSFNITDRNIVKAFPNPITCQKMRSYVKDENSRINCACDNREDSCPLTKVDKVKFGSIMIEDEVKKIVEKIMKLKGEKKSIERNITQLENNLDRIFIDNNVTEIPTDIGKLKKKEEKWIIELEI